jgi:hypothetical protein
MLGALLTTPDAAGQNRIVNGGFEDGLNNWLLGNGFDGTVNVATTSTDTPSGSGNSADLDINESLGLPWLIQDVPVTVGEMVSLSASVREARQFIPPGTNPSFPEGVDAWIAAQIYMLPNSESGTILSYGFTTYTSPTWETKGFEIEVPAGATIARVLFTPQDPDFGVGTGRYLIDDVSLTVPDDGLIGDYNQNNVVDAADYSVWRDTLGSTTSLDADGDDSGTVDAADYDVWTANFGETGSVTGATASVPEPTALTLACVFFLATLWWRRHR